ncbi:MAG: hypothetical protein H8D45_08025 [Bacteroidetes bacterium]|nr:hypothetical protein [Bacteroidota bacterium]
MKNIIRGNYDTDYLSTPEYSEQEEIFLTCDACGKKFPEDNIITDKVKGKETGWYYCLACFSLKI